MSLVSTSIAGFSLVLLCAATAQADPFLPCGAPARLEIADILTDDEHAGRTRTALDRYSAETMRYLECVERMAERDGTPETAARARQLKQARIDEHKAVILKWNAVYGARLGLGKREVGNAR